MKIQNILNFNINLKKTNDKFFKNSNIVLRNNLKNDTFEKSTLTFKGQKCSTDDFKIKMLYDMPCPSCGDLMVVDNQLDSFAKSVRGKRGDDLVKILKRYDKYYRPTEKTVVDELLKNAKEFPNLNLSDLTKVTSVVHREGLTKAQSAVLNELKGMAELIDDEGKKEIYLSFIDNTLERANSFGEVKSSFKRKKFIESLYNICEDIKDEETLEKIMQVAERLPKSTNDPSAFFVKYSRRGEEEIARRLLSPALATTEHVKPKSKEGANNTANYMAMCANCNSKRGNMPYHQWFKEYPDMPLNLQKYLNEVGVRLNGGEVIGYNSYPQEIAETLEKETQGEVLLDVPEIELSKKHRDRKIGRIPKTIDERLELMESTILRKQDELDFLKEKFEELKGDEDYKNLVMYDKLQKELDKALDKKNKAFDSLDEVNKEIRFNKSKIRRKEKLEEKIQIIQTEKSKDKKTKQNKNEEILKYREYIKQVIQKIVPEEELEAKKEEARKQYATASADFEEKKQGFDSFLVGFKTAADYIKEAGEVDSKIMSINSIKKNVAALNEKVQDKKDILNAKNQLNSRIKALKSELAYSEFDGSEMSQNLRTYYALKKKEKFLNSLTDHDITFKVKVPKSIKPYFIVDEAKKSIQNQIDELSSDALVRYKQIEDEIADLMEFKGEYDLKLDGIRNAEAQLVSLNNKLDKLQEEGTLQELEAKYKNLCSRRADLDEKAKYLDIEKRIAQLTVNIEELSTRLSELAEMRDI